MLSFHINDNDDNIVLSPAGAVPNEPGNFLVFCFLACSYIIVSITKVPIISFPTCSRTRSAALLLLLLFLLPVLFHFLLATTLMFATQKLTNAISQLSYFYPNSAILHNKQSKCAKILQLFSHSTFSS